MNELISIIVPVYNVEKYLSKCIESIINQTYKNLEIILVDDGSPDNCGKICDEYARKDKRIKVLHKENGGQGSARNLGLDNSTGEYIAFVDSDDWIELDMYERMYKEIKNSNSDIAICGIYNVTRIKTIQSSVCEDVLILNNQELMRDYFTTTNIHSVPWNKLYNKKLWANLRFPENKYREDAFICYKVLSMAEKAVHIAKAKYFYLVRDGSSEHQKFSEKNLVSNELLDDEYEFVKQNYPELKKVLWDKRIKIRQIQIRDIILSRQQKKYKSVLDEMILFLRDNKAYDSSIQKQSDEIINRFRWTSIKLIVKNTTHVMLKRVLMLIRKNKIYYDTHI